MSRYVGFHVVRSGWLGDGAAYRLIYVSEVPSLTRTITCPTGMYGLAIEPWSKGEVYAVAADWAQAGAPVYTYGRDGWDIDQCGRQVADFRHSPRAALADVLRNEIGQAGQQKIDEKELDGLLDDAERIG